MEITRVPPDTRPGPSEWFTGTVWIDPVSENPAPSRVRVLSVHFNPGARTAWHHHPFGQVLHITEGVGLVGRRGERPQRVRAGDTVRFEPAEEHWHGAGPTTFMTHIAVQEAGDDGETAQWGAHVSDEDYLSDAEG